jgi:hypothetical protein
MGIGNELGNCGRSEQHGISVMVGRPFQKGISGNPGGRPKGIGAKAREHADAALQILVEGMADNDPRIRMIAAKEILDRGWGKAVAMTAEVQDPFARMSDEDLEAAILELDTVISAARASGDPGDTKR